MSSSASEVYEEIFPEADDEGSGKMYALLFADNADELRRQVMEMRKTLTGLPP